MSNGIKNIDSPSFLVNFISSNMNAEVAEKQKMLEVADLRERSTLLLAHLTKELQLLEMKNEIQSKVRTEVDKQQREYFLHQQMKTIQDELGGNPIEQEIEEGKHEVSSVKAQVQSAVDTVARTPAAAPYRAAAAASEPTPAGTNITAPDRRPLNHATADHGPATTRHDPAPNRRRRPGGSQTPLRARPALHICDWRRTPQRQTRHHLGKGQLVLLVRHHFEQRGLAGRDRGHAALQRRPQLGGLGDQFGVRAQRAADGGVVAGQAV